MTADPFAAGQRWLSNSEPELGLGLVISSAKGRITLLFPATGDTRQYAVGGAPLTRMVFHPGSEIKGHDGTSMLVEEVVESGGVLTYRGGGRELAESALADSLNFTRPEDRLLNAQLDDKSLFNLRSKGLHHRFETLRGHQRGFLGPRIELIPHQLFAALQIRRKGIPRLVLADESGTGKTIIACLVLHRLLVTARLQRALIIVPQALLSRWHYELARRFHLPVPVLEAGDGAPLAPDQELVLCCPNTLPKAAELPWDLLIVDEADAVESPHLEPLCQATPGVILLTDLPPRTEKEAHRRLRQWLDGGGNPTPVPSLGPVLAEKLLTQSTDPWTEEEIAALQDLTGSPVDQPALTAEQGDGRERMLAALIEGLGAGRRLLRNTRAVIEGLPEREVLSHKLSLPESPDSEWLRCLTQEFDSDARPLPAAVRADDPRLTWLVDYLEKNERDKLVLICSTADRATAIAGHLGNRAALHHEGMPLVERDRSIHRFTEKDGQGASVLVCSEIGAEARALPFAHHLVLFDLPPDPLRIQKRIGSLDRFGHMAKVRVHIPFVEGTPSEPVYRWFHEALDVFEHPLPVVHACGRAFGPKFRALITQDSSAWPDALPALLAEAKAHKDEQQSILQSEPDRLTDLASYRVLPAHRLLESVRRLDSDLSLDFLMLRLFDHFGFDAEDVGERTYHLRPREKDRKPGAFPTIEAEGQLVTFERHKALSRDDLWFLTWDSPVVMEHIELLIRSIEGNACYAVWEDLRSQIILLESLFRIELAQPPQKLYPTRFFSPAGVRLIINHKLEDVSAEYPMELINKNVSNGRREWMRTNETALRHLLPRMLVDLTQRAQSRAEEMKTQALADLDAQLLPEIDRLSQLQQRGGPVSDFELQLLQSEYDVLKQSLARPVVRLDSLRLVRRGPTGKGI
ncbi:MAG: RNA polymerase-associated protein RapA [Verrucomicrobiales bacterium]